MSSDPREEKHHRVKHWPYWATVLLVLMVFILILFSDKNFFPREVLTQNDCLRDKKDQYLGNMAEILGEEKYNRELSYASSIQARHSAEWFKMEGVSGHGVGACSYELCIFVYVSKENYCEVRSRIPREIDGVQIRIFDGETARAF